ncbi:hypothetical protein [Parabacteroides sp. PF5-9]|uniref:hypothetical protein n=1 Tax=Parabacteroides sp. PF5-9 TaxID=1742404 RepID=UPI0024748E1C|nr:hypothetical protein [Parabacteroides sp. PF5-9]MDH6357633.1 hypothetical protein [Parabacteroides sp. PF5-9]
MENLTERLDALEQQYKNAIGKKEARIAELEQQIADQKPNEDPIIDDFLIDISVPIDDTKIGACAPCMKGSGSKGVY